MRIRHFWQLCLWAGVFVVPASMVGVAMAADNPRHLATSIVVGIALWAAPTACAIHSYLSFNNSERDAERAAAGNWEGQ